MNDLQASRFRRAPLLLAVALAAVLGGCTSGRDRGPAVAAVAAVAEPGVVAPSQQTQAQTGEGLQGWLPQPGAGFFMAAYEDSAPQPGDYDLNDLVVAYQYRLGLDAAGLVERIEGQAFIVARGSDASHDWTLDLRLPPGAAATAECRTVTPEGQPLPCAITAQSGQLRWQAFRDTRAAFPAAAGAAGPVNTVAGASFARGPKASFTVRFDPAVSLHTVGAGDPWLKLLASGRELHVDERSSSGLPLALLVPAAAWQPPLEHVDMALAYPRLPRFVSTMGLDAQDWWRDPLAGRTQALAGAPWSW